MKSNIKLYNKYNFVLKRKLFEFSLISPSDTFTLFVVENEETIINFTIKSLYRLRFVFID